MTPAIGPGGTVRLEPPYPDLATLCDASEVHLRVAVAGRGQEVVEALRQLGADRLSLAVPETILLQGQLGPLLARARSWPPGTEAAALAEAIADTLTRLRGPAPDLRFGDRVWEFGHRTYLIGVVNVTPDSFSGDGVGRDPLAAVARAQELVAAGADAIDLGGESTRPGHRGVGVEEEIGRVLPAVELLGREVSVPVFVDTSKAAVAAAALAAGAAGVNDVWGLQRDPEMGAVVAAAGVPLICMHNQAGHDYADLMGEVLARLQLSIELALRAGIPRNQLVIDPGIGFGKVPAQNLEVLRRLIELRVLGCPILVGTSRKSLIGWLLDDRQVGGRLLGTAASVAWSIVAGADIVRVHDVAEIHDVAVVLDALSGRERG